MAKLGDMVCTTPMFRAVKDKYPQAKIFVIGNSINKELLAGNPDVDKYLVWENNFWQLIKELKKEKIDFACSTHPNFRGLALLYLAMVESIAVPIIKNGFSPVETRLYKLLRNFVVTAPHNMGNYVPKEYLRLLEPIGIFSENTKKNLYFTKQAKDTIAKFFREKSVDTEKDFIIGISPSVGNKIKEWDLNNFAKLADYISFRYHAKIVIIGGRNDTDRATEMAESLNPDTKFVNSAGLFSIDELKALISKLSLFISVDTGPVYVAEAFNVPTIDIIGPMDENEQPPRGELHKIVKLEARVKPAIHIMNSSEYDYEEARRQIKGVSVDMVIKEAEFLIKSMMSFKKNE